MVSAALSAQIEALWVPGAPDRAVVLLPSRRKWLVVAAIGAGFVAAAILISDDPTDSWGPTMRWLTGAFFGLVTIVGLVAMLPGAGALELRRDGFTTVSMFRRATTPWTQAAAFRVGYLGGAPQKFVVFDLVGPTADGAGARLSAVIAGAHGALPDTYGLSAEDLAALMNQMCERALAGRI